MELTGYCDLVYRGESTFAEHGLGPIDAHITGSDPWKFTLEPIGGTPAMESVAVMVRITADFLVVSAQSDGGTPGCLQDLTAWLLDDSQTAGLTAV